MVDACVGRLFCLCGQRWDVSKSVWELCGNVGGRNGGVSTHGEEDVSCD